MSAKMVFQHPPENFIPKKFQNLVFDKASAPDLQQAQPTRKQAMCKHMVDGRGCKGGDASAVKNQILKFLGYNPKVEVAACFITVKDNVLFIKRHAHCSEPSKWGIPGGKLEKGETAHQAVLREIKEETGIHLTSEVKHLGTVYIRYPEVDFVYHMYGHTLSEFPEQIVIDPEEHQEYRWVTLKEALALPLIRGEDECIYLVYGENP